MIIAVRPRSSAQRVLHQALDAVIERGPSRGDVGSERHDRRGAGHQGRRQTERNPAADIETVACQPGDDFSRDRVVRLGTSRQRAQR
jgi:hypothetical protein